MADSYYGQLTSLVPSSATSLIPDWITIPYLFQQVITVTPLLSYGSTIHSIHRNKSTMGFSLDICLTMIISASCRLSYFMFGGFDDVGLVRQAVVMVFVQVAVLFVALKYHQKDEERLHDEVDYWLEMRVSYQELRDFSSKDDNNLLETLARIIVILHDVFKLHLVKFVRLFDPVYQRPYQFWQWSTAISPLEISPYWKTVIYIEAFIFFTTLAFHSYFPFLGTILGTFGLFIESLLPLPQILLLLKIQTIKGFKLMLLVSWLCGDFTKISYLMFGEGNKGPLFMIFAIWQMGLDFYIGYLYIWFKYFKETAPETYELKDVEQSRLKV